MSEDSPVTNGEQPEKDTRFKPGNNANPNGRPKGSRNRLGEDFLKALADDFEQHGAESITKVRTDRPQDYLKVIASILPKQAEITVNEYERMDDGQLRAALSSALRDLATLGIDIGVANGEGEGDPGSPQSAKVVSPLH